MRRLMNRYIAGTAVGLCLLLGSAAASAAAVLSMDMNPATGTIDAASSAQPSSSTTASIEFTGDNVVTNVSGAIEYDTTKVTVTNAPITESYSNDLRMIQIQLTWKSGGVLHKRQATTFVSQYGLQRYVY